MIERDWRSTWTSSIWQRSMWGAPGTETLLMGYLARHHGNVMRWHSHWTSDGELSGGGRSVRRYTGSWCYVEGTTWNCESKGTTGNVCCMQYSVYAVLSVWCTRCMLYSVYAVLGVCWTRWMLYSVYAVLGVCCTLCILHSVTTAVSVKSWWWHVETERDDLSLCSCDDGKVVYEKERDGAWRREQYGGYRTAMRNQV